MVDEKKRSLDQILQDMEARLLAAENKAAVAEKKAETLTEQVKAQSTVRAFVAATTVGRSKDGIINQAPNVVTKPKLIDEPANVQKDGTPYEYKHNVCPYCNMNKEANIIDQVPGGGWSCRVCAKNFAPWQWKYPYSLQLEQNDRENDYLRVMAIDKAHLGS